MTSAAKVNWAFEPNASRRSSIYRETIVGTATEKEAICERNKLLERRERNWIDEHTKVYYELKQYLHDSAINMLKRFQQRWEQVEAEKNPVK